MGFPVSMAMILFFRKLFFLRIIHEEFNNQYTIIILAAPMTVSIDCVKAAMVYIVDIYAATGYRNYIKTYLNIVI